MTSREGIAAGAVRPARVPAAGLLVGVAAVAAGLLLGLVWLQQRFAPQLLALPPVPFFDALASFRQTPALMIAHGLTAVALLVTGGAILTRQSFAPLLFVVLGWGGLLFTALAAWPGDGLRRKVQLLLDIAKERGRLPRDATVWSVIPTEYFVYAGLFLVLWLIVLVLGTVHLLRRRDLYGR